MPSTGGRRGPFWAKPLELDSPRRCPRAAGLLGAGWRRALSGPAGKDRVAGPGALLCWDPPCWRPMVWACPCRSGGASQARWRTRVLPRRDAPCGDMSFACDPVTRCLRVSRGTSDVGGEWSPLGAWRRARWTIGGLEHCRPAGKGPVLPLLCPHHSRYCYPSSPRQLPSLWRLESYGAGPRGRRRHTTCY